MIYYMPMQLYTNKNSENHPVISNRRQLTFAQKSADAMTQAMGSWPFIFYFLFFVALWVILIGYWKGWDPYPFILLNLALSLISALQAPIIMMSQNRQADRDRIAAKYDYAVNRKVDREVQNMQKDLEEIKDMLEKIINQKKSEKK